MPDHTQLLQQAETIFKKPKMFCVILHNDDFTTTEFVVHLLTKVFQKNPAEANAIMIEVHEGGIGVAGIYPYDLAMTKKMRADKLARESGFPLRISIDEAMG